MAQLRKKIDRQTVIWVALLALGAFLAGLFILKGPGLGQSQEQARRAQEMQDKLQKEYAAKVHNPQAYTEEQLARARQAIEKTQPAAPASLPMPPVTQDAMLRYARALEAIEKAKQRGADRSDHPEPAEQAPASFVLFSAGHAGASAGLLHLGTSRPQAAASSASAPGHADADAQLQAVLKAAYDSPAVQRAQEQLAAYQSQQAAAQRMAAAQQAADVGGQNARWLFQAQNEAVKTVPPNIVAQKNAALYWIAPGTTIPAVLLNAIDTQLPGTITARVTQDVYDSRYGKYLVIPRGSILRGKYNASIQDGQNRVLMVFDTLVTPAGGEVPLGNMSASDALGRAGVQGTLHTHFWERIGISTLLALEAVGMDRLAPNTTTVGIGGTSTSPAADGAQIIVNTANQELQRRYSVSPNITIPPGALLNIVTTGGIEVPPIANAR